MGQPASPLSSRPTQVRLLVLVFACTLSFMAYLDRVCIMRVSGEMQADLNMTPQMMGFIFSAFGLGYALFEVPGGWMGDRWGARLALTRVVVCWSLFTCLTGSIWLFSFDSGWYLPLGSWQIPLVFNSFVLLLLVRLIFGMGEAGAFPNLTRVVGLWFPYRERGLAQGAIWMSARLGGAIAPLVIGTLAVYLGWRGAFWCLGGIGVVWAIAFCLWFRDRPEDKASCNQAERDLIQTPPLSASSEHATNATPRSQSLPAVHSWPPLLPLLYSVSLWALCGASFGICFGWYFYPTWQPQFLQDVYGLDFKDSEILIGLPFLFGALGCLVGGRLLDYLVLRTGSKRWGRSLVGAIGFAGAAVCFLLACHATSAWQAVTLLCLAAVLNDLAIPVLWVISADLGGRYVGTVSGLMNMIGAFGGMLSPVLIPYLVKKFKYLPPAEGWQIILTILAIGWFCSACLCLLINAGKPIFSESDKTAAPRVGDNE